MKNWVTPATILIMDALGGYLMVGKRMPPMKC